MKISNIGRQLWLLAVLTLGSALVAPAAHAQNLAAGKPAFSDWTTNTPAANVTDDNFGTQWNNGGSPSAPADHIGVDLGSPQPIKYVRIFWPGGAAPTTFNIEVATTVDLTNDPSGATGDWTPVYQRQNVCDVNNAPSPQPASPDFIDLSAQNLTNQYVRINASDGPDPCNATPVTGWGVVELQIRSTPLPSLSGTVTANGSPLANALVQLSGPEAVPGGPPTNLTSLRTDAGGNYTFTGLDPGKYTIVAFAPGQYAPSQAIVQVGNANVTQNMSFTVPVTNSTAEIPAFQADFIADAASPVGSANYEAGGLNLPSDEMPADEAIWNTSAALPAGATIGSLMPSTLKFFFPPITGKKNNVLNAANVTIPFDPAHYTALYMLQVGVDQALTTSALLNYTDGTSASVTTSTGSLNYTIPVGNNGTGPGTDGIVAFTVDHRLNVNTGAVDNVAYQLYMRTIFVDSTKILKSLSFGTPNSGGGTLQKGAILAWSADSLEVPAAPASISGTIKSPTGSAVNNAQVTINEVPGFVIVTDSTGTYKFNGLPPGTYTIGASKAANYARKTISVTLASVDKTGQDIQFTAPIPVVTDALSSPTLDMVSSDTNIADATISDFVLGREYIPTGLYSPDTGPVDPIGGKYDPDSGAPGALPFSFGNITDTPVAPGTVGYPTGGTPNTIVPHGAVVLAPPAQVFNVYFAIVGFEGGIQLAPTLHYTDGTSEQKVVRVADWFQDISSDELRYIVMHGRHQLTGLAAGNEANVGGTIRIAALVVPVNSTKQLKDIYFDEGQTRRQYPCILAISFETAALQPASSDVKVHVTASGGGAAAGAIVTLGPYDTLADANGDAIFKGIPAGLSLGAGAYLSGVTQQARVEGHVIPAGQKLPTPDTINLTLPASTPTFVNLPLYRDFDYIAALDMPGDYKTAAQGDRSWRAEAMPTPGTTFTLGNVPYTMPHSETGYNNVLRMNGQTIPVTPGHYSSIDLLASGVGVGNNATGIYFLTLNYQDGSSDQVQFAVADWTPQFSSATVNWGFPETMNKRMFYRQVMPGASNPTFMQGRRGGFNTDDTSYIAFIPCPNPVNSSKVLTSFKFVEQKQGFEADDASFLAVTLESNDASLTSGTITGTVVGRPLTNNGGTIGPVAADQPIPFAEVMVDAGHAGYTDATGAFSIPNVPLGARNMTIIPFGTGILSRTVPVVGGVVAGVNNVGTLNAGSGVTKIFVQLGPTNVSQGLQQIEGYVDPYIRDAGRPTLRYTIPDSGTVPGVLGGKTCRVAAYAGDYFYLQADPGWLYRGKIGSVGLDPATFVNNAGAFNGTIGPHVYVTIEYFDRGTDSFLLQYNSEMGGINPIAGVPTFRNGQGGGEVYHNPTKYVDPNDKTKGTNSYNVVKTGSNTWKTFTYELNGVLPEAAVQIAPTQQQALGLYKAMNLQADMRIDPQNSGTNPAEAFRSITISLVPGTPVLPGRASDALRFAGGLLTATPADVAQLDQNGDGRITIIDASRLARAGQY